MTGGVETLTRATVYTDAGFLRDLPPLNHERHNHGCGHYVNQDLDTVSTHRNTTHDECLVTLPLHQVLLVAGGIVASTYLASTEVMAVDSSWAGRGWADVGQLPSPRHGLRGVSLNNDIIMTGW